MGLIVFIGGERKWRDAVGAPIEGGRRKPGQTTFMMFNSMCEKLSDYTQRSRPGSVFLVGAGVLGKIYVDIIKTNGGIAVDMGSTLDFFYPDIIPGEYLT